MATQVEVVKEEETDSYRLVIFSGSGTLVLLHREDSRYSLPVVSIRKYTRLAKELSTLLQEKWRIRSVLLFASQLQTKDGSITYVVAEARNQVQSLAENMDWFPVHQAESQLLHGPESELLQQSRAKAVVPIQKEDAEPFSKLGWFDDLTDWTETILSPQGIGITGFQQVNGSETFALVRIDTTKKPVWFKAVGEPNLHEYSITIGLAKLFPEFMPHLLGARPDWHGWLMEDSGGIPLWDVADPAVWKNVATTLARLQVESVDKVPAVVTLGCRDLRTDRLVHLLDPFFEAMHGLMQRQTKSPPKIINLVELLELKRTLLDALGSMASLQVPNTLGHGDFNPGNVIADKRRCVFIDWAEAYVGHPFLTFEYFVAHLKKDYPQLALIENDLRASYSRVWSSIISQQHIAEAYRLSPLVAIYAYAIAGNTWRDPERLKIPGFEGYLRSLTRKMKQEADLLQAQKAECTI